MAQSPCCKGDVAPWFSLTCWLSLLMSCDVITHTHTHNMVLFGFPLYLPTGVSCERLSRESGEGEGEGDCVCLSRGTVKPPARCVIVHLMVLSNDLFPIVLLFQHEGGEPQRKAVSWTAGVCTVTVPSLVNREASERRLYVSMAAATLLLQGEWLSL